MPSLQSTKRWKTLLLGRVFPKRGLFRIVFYLNIILKLLKILWKSGVNVLVWPKAVALKHLIKRKSRQALQLPRKLQKRKAPSSRRWPPIITLCWVEEMPSAVWAATHPSNSSPISAGTTWQLSYQSAVQAEHIYLFPLPLSHNLDFWILVEIE